jgi:3D (Asp-Asp-Asp) domain-containing protein/cell division protein FtsB
MESKRMTLKEGMMMALPFVLFVGMIGTLAWKGYEQDRKNDDIAVQLKQSKLLVAKYDQLNSKLQKENVALKNQVEQLQGDKQGLEFAISKLKQDGTLYMNGHMYFARQTITASASAYTQSDEEQTADGITASGEPVKEGRTIAVDPSVIALGSLVYIESDSPLVGGFYVASDTGGAIKGNRIDVFMQSKDKAYQFGRQDIKVTILQGVTLK